MNRLSRRRGRAAGKGRIEVRQMENNQEELERQLQEDLPEEPEQAPAPEMEAAPEQKGR